MNVDRMLAEITERQRVEWHEWMRLNHLAEDPEWRADVRMAIQTMHLVNMQIPNKRDRIKKVETFMPAFTEPNADAPEGTPPTPIDQAAAFRNRMLDYAKRSKRKPKESDGRRNARKTQGATQP